MYTPFTPMVAAVQPSLLWSLQRHTLLRLRTVTTALQNAKSQAACSLHRKIPGIYFILGIGVIHAGCAKNRDEPLWTRQALSRNAWLLSPAGALLMF